MFQPACLFAAMILTFGMIVLSFQIRMKSVENLKGFIEGLSNLYQCRQCTTGFSIKKRLGSAHLYQPNAAKYC